MALDAQTSRCTHHHLLLTPSGRVPVQLSEYLSIKKPPEKAALASAEREGAADAAEGRAEAEAEEAAASSEGPNQASSHEELQCKTTVAMCVLTGQGMLEAMQRAVQQSHSLHHSAACRLVADTFLEVVDDLGSAAMSDEMVEVQRKVDRVNSRFFHVSDLIARNAMAAADNTDSAAAAAQSLNPAPQSVPPSVSRERGGGAQPELGRRLETLEEPEEKRPAIDRRVALEQFGGDEGFFRRMCAKFITSGGGVVSRISRLAATEDGELDYAEVRREAHSMKGASSTIGAMQLSQAGCCSGPLASCSLPR